MNEEEEVFTPTITKTKPLSLEQFLRQLGNRQYRSDLIHRNTPAADYLIRNAKTKTIGKELTPYVQSGVQMLGNAYQDTMWKARRGMLGPHALIGSHAIDTLGKIIPDIPLDKGISSVAHEGLGIDKPLADVGGHIGEMLITRKILKSGVPAAYNALNKQPWAHNYMYARGQTLRSNIDRMGKELNTAANVVDRGLQRIGLKPRIYKGGKPPGSVPMESRSVAMQRAVNDAFSRDKTLLGEYTYGSVVKPGSLFSKDYKGILSKPQPYAYAASSGGRPPVQETTATDLSLFDARPDQFINAASKNVAEQNAATWMAANKRSNLSGYGGSRYTVNGKYYKLHIKGGEVVSTPYNRYMTSVANAFKPPQDLINKWKALEGTVLTGTQGWGNVPVQVGTQGKVISRPVLRRILPGTVDKFEEWYKDLIGSQVETQHFFERVQNQMALLGADKFARGKGKLSLDKSHFKPRSKGGPGLTFLEAWHINQARKDLDILPDSVMIEAGIPTTWNELFIYFTTGKETALGPLDDINIDDFFALEQGQSLDAVVSRREYINSLIETAKGDSSQIDILQRKFAQAMANAKGKSGVYSLGEAAGYEKVQGVWTLKDTEVEELIEEADILGLPPGPAKTQKPLNNKELSSIINEAFSYA